MYDAIAFVLSIVVIVFILAIGVYKSGHNAKTFWDTSSGKNVLGGILMVIAIAMIWALTSHKVNAARLEPTPVIPTIANYELKPRSIDGTWFSYGEMFVGLDYTFDHSPNCKPDQYNDRWTSNVGFRFNIYRSGSELFEWNAKYQHHSCAFNQDDLRYDAVGIELTLKLWNK